MKLPRYAVLTDCDTMLSLLRTLNMLLVAHHDFQAESQKNYADVTSKVEIENQAPDLISDLNGGNKKV
jgi:hypothetical protein